MLQGGRHDLPVPGRDLETSVHIGKGGRKRKRNVPASLRRVCILFLCWCSAEYVGDGIIA